MSNLVNTYQISDSKELKIFYDDCPNDPRTWDNISTMICFHNRYNLGDSHNYSSSDFNSWSEFEKQLKIDYDIAVILPLYLYDHSGITIRTTPFSCSWDSGQVGFIFITKEELRSTYGIKRITKKWLEKVEKYLVSDVEVYDQYLTGDIYGYELVEKIECECGHVEENVLDSCWGFFGNDLKENGILDNLNDEERSIVEQQL